MSAPPEGFAPNLNKWLRSLPAQSDPETSLEQLIPLIKRRQVDGAQDIATATAHCLGQIVEKSQWSDVDTLLANVQRAGGKLMHAKPMELVTGNIVRRVLGLIRTEAAENRNDQNPSETPSEGMMTPVEATHPPLTISTPERPAMMRPGVSTMTLPGRSLSHLLSATTLSDQEGLVSPFGTSGASTPLQKGGASSGRVNELRQEIVGGIQEIIEEIDQEAEQIGLQADGQVRPGDNILLHKPGASAQRLILRLAQRRKFTVWILESSPQKSEGQDAVPYAAFRNKLKKAKCSAKVFCGNGPGAIMPRINRVFIEASAITGSGAAVTDVHGPTIALAAREANLPVFVLAGIYKFGPQIPFKDRDVIDRAACPEEFWHSTFEGCGMGLVPTTQLIPAKYIDQYISNIGVHHGSLLDEIIDDHYNPADRNLHVKLLEEDRARL